MFFCGISFAKKYAMKTPYYYYDLDLLEQTLQKLLAVAGNSHIHYAVKANTDKRICRMISNYGLGADCVSGNEIIHALRCGFHPSKIVFAGVGKTDEEIEIGLKHNIACFNVESAQELEVLNQLAIQMGRKANVAIRVNPNIDADTHQYITTGKYENKFGISYEYLLEIIEFIEDSAQLNLTGLHFHIGSQILNMDNFKNLASNINLILSELYNEGIEIEHINVGGGLGINYDNPIDEPIPHFQSYFEVFNQHLNNSLFKHLHFELGRSIVGQCGELHTKVLYLKQGIAKQFAIVDAGMTDLIRPALYQAQHRIIKKHVTEDKIYRYDIVGPICESSDVFRRDYPIEKLSRGDELIIKSAGAYGEVMTSAYNLRDKPRVCYREARSSLLFDMDKKYVQN